MTENLVKEATDYLVNKFESQGLGYGEAIFSSDEAKSFFHLILARPNELGREEFVVAYLDTQNHLITYEVLFTGTINKCAVYPREVVKRCLELNAASIIVGHNHPSGDTFPSNDDEEITKLIKKGLNLFNMNLLDHIIVGLRPFSMRGDLACGNIWDN